LEMNTRLEYVLSIFKQEKLVIGDKRLKDYAYEIEDELLQKILKRLTKAAADNVLLEQMEKEELAQHEYENALGSAERKIQEHEKTIEKKDKSLEEHKKTIEDKDKSLEDKDKSLEEHKKTIEDKDKYIRELLKKIEGK
jgi:uncharacterized protein (DUF3084 family)